MISDSRELEKTLQKPDVHQEWENAYRTQDNACFYDMAFEHIVSMLGDPATSTVLDAGCGICDYSLRLARHGFHLTAVDFSESVLENAKATIAAHGCQDKIRLQREDLLSLSFDDGCFDIVVCWGVLMHIPDVRLATSELARVLKPGGVLIISEGNCSSVESLLLRWLKSFLGKQKEEVVDMPAGVEYWATGPAGRLLSRQAHVPWLVEQFKSLGLALKVRTAGQFTELYGRTSQPALQKAFHAFNRFWFRHVRFAGPAFGNILLLQKPLRVFEGTPK